MERLQLAPSIETRGWGLFGSRQLDHRVLLVQRDFFAWVLHGSPAASAGRGIPVSPSIRAGPGPSPPPSAAAEARLSPVPAVRRPASPEPAEVLRQAGSLPVGSFQAEDQRPGDALGPLGAPQALAHAASLEPLGRERHEQCQTELQTRARERARLREQGAKELDRIPARRSEPRHVHVGGAC